MSCPSVDLKAYLLEEAAPEERRAAESHLKTCGGCREELDRLRLTQAALFTLRDEEVPRRIAFVSDKVFEPRWHERLWQSGPRLGFAGAAMLAVAIFTHALTRPAQVVTQVPVAGAQNTLDVDRAIRSAVDKALGEADARHRQESARMLAAAEKKFDERQRETMATVEASFEVLSKRINVLRVQTASLGAQP